MRRRLLALALLSTAPPAVAASAEDAPSSVRRELGGHRFMISHLVEDPFSVTSFGVHLAIGAGEALGPALDLTTFPPTVLRDERWYGYVTVVNQFDLTARIVENLSLHAALLTGVRQGGGEGAALVVGSAVQISGLLGVKGSLALGDSLRLSVTGQGIYGPHMNLLILQGLLDAYQAGSFAAADLFQDRNATSLAATAAAAWGPAPWLGVEANAGYLYTKSEDISGSTKTGLAGAGSVELDALPLVSWLPFGTAVSYRRTGSLGEGGLASSEEWSWAVHYTGRPDLVLGVEADRIQGRLETSQSTRQTIGWLNFRYYW